MLANNHELFVLTKQIGYLCIFAVHQNVTRFYGITYENRLSFMIEGIVPFSI